MGGMLRILKDPAGVATKLMDASVKMIEKNRDQDERKEARNGYDGHGFGSERQLRAVKLLCWYSCRSHFRSHTLTYLDPLLRCSLLSTYALLPSASRQTGDHSSFYSGGILTGAYGTQLDHSMFAVGCDINSNYGNVKNS